MKQASALIAEVMGLRDDIKAALGARIQYLKVEGDNQIVIDAIKGLAHAPWKIQTLTQDIRVMLSNFHHISFTHIY